ncbi:transmembrane protein 104 homolog isoform X2 [Ischnura elegans]|uniref:transmembrane protein 104 homolog isoform X2 n=1 Tax=Ischnura elegans TaxID=197161 RepID=UPI001ED87EC3|nr:transmembrane protein 104 homolog isoform X2 [Ischnura elegans]
MSATHPGDRQYSKWMGLAYIFNLIVGTGALTLPAAFGKAGWILAAVVIVVLAFISYVTVTFVVEAMASTNAILQRKRLQERANSIQATDDQHSDQLLHQCDITEQVEMGQMASVLLNRVGQILFYLCIIVYLYGDLAIYCSAVAQSVADVTCSYLPPENPCNSTLPEDILCWEGSKFSRKDAYRIYLGVFIMLFGPFAFFNVQKTKYLQIISTLMRWIAFSIMTGYAVRDVIMEKDNQEVSPPPAVQFSGIPALFGACVYSFMCHHSIPALVTPIADKSRLAREFALDYVLIAIFYLLLALTGVFAFYPNLHDLYTLDFWQTPGCAARPGIPPPGVGYFLALFPVFTLSASFPIIAVTLRGNLEALILPPKPLPPSPSEVGVTRLARRLLMPLIAVAPPAIVAFATEDLGTLVGVTGSFAGAGVQYILPAVLVAAARRELVRQNNGEALPSHRFSSPFRGNPWVVFVLVWAVACVTIVTVRLAEQL